MENQSLDPFYSLVFQTVLALGGILFGVFGFLYSIFATYIILETPPSAVNVIKKLCQITSCLVTLSIIISFYALYLLIPFNLFAERWNTNNTILCSGIILIGVLTSIITLYISFVSMSTRVPSPESIVPSDDEGLKNLQAQIEAKDLIAKECPSEKNSKKLVK